MVNLIEVNGWGKVSEMVFVCVFFCVERREIEMSGRSV